MSNKEAIRQKKPTRGPRRGTVHTIYEALADRYGHPQATHPSGKPIDVLVETILSQHTSDKNSHRAYLQLRRTFPRWADLLTADPREIERAIQSGGLAKQKSVRIQRVLRIIAEREGRISLACLRRLSDQDAYNYLTSLPGIGDKTACCVLLFALGRAVMPVDTHIHRIIKRLGWIAPSASPEAARQVLERTLPADILYHMHVLLIAHGRQTCQAQRPRCRECPIRLRCPSRRLAVIGK